MKIPDPYVLRCSLDSHIIPNFNFFKDLTGCDDDKVLVAYKRFPAVLERDFQSLVAPNLALLRECGVPKSNIVSKRVVYPLVFAQNHGKFERAVEEVKKLGFNPLKQVFLSALKALIASAFGKFPICLMLSEHKVKAAMNFYVNTMGLKSSYIANRPLLLGLRLEKELFLGVQLFKFCCPKV
ncbi:Transcription termination factor [Theobroma cacao]|nr:Transcription termination factor [Theobroma cacao]